MYDFCLDKMLPESSDFCPQIDYHQFMSKTIVGKATEATLKREVKDKRAVLAERLLELRIDADLSQARLAEIAGVDRKTINRIENGHFSPALDTIVRLSVALGITPSALLAK